jgi:hypothetical protein
MPKKVATIDGVFSIDGIGTMIALPTEDQWDIDPKELIHRRERIQIRTRSGNCLSTFIRDIVMINRGRDRRRSPTSAMNGSIMAGEWALKGLLIEFQNELWKNAY